MNIEEQYRTIAADIVTSFKSDLDFDVENYIIPKIPAVFALRETGSCAIGFNPIEFYPPQDIRVPYLFGTATREHILKQSTAMLFCSAWKDAKGFVYFDGQNLTHLTIKDAEVVVKRYVERMTREFASDSGYRRPA